MCMIHVLLFRAQDFTALMLLWVLSTTVVYSVIRKGEIPPPHGIGIHYTAPTRCFVHYGVYYVIRDGCDTNLQGMGPHYTAASQCFVHYRNLFRNFRWILTLRTPVFTTLLLLSVLSNTGVYSVFRDGCDTNLPGIGLRYTAAPQCFVHYKNLLRNLGWTLILRTPVFTTLLLLSDFFPLQRSIPYLGMGVILPFREWVLTTVHMICALSTVGDGCDSNRQDMGPHYTAASQCFVHCRDLFRNFGWILT